MKKYVEYMDNVKTSDTLHQRLLELEAPQKRPIPWKKYGAAAAALALVVGVGAWGLGKDGWNGLAANFQPTAVGPEGPESIDQGPKGVPEPAIVEDPNESLEPGMKTIGGYEVQQGEMVSYFMLPGIDYGMADGVGQTALDWDVPPGSVRRDLTPVDIAALFGKEENLTTHLGWGGYTLTGWAAWLEDGSLWGVWIDGYKGPLDHFELAFTAGDKVPPTCIAYGEGVVNELWGVPVTAWGHDGRDGCDRRVELIHDGYGFRFDITGTDEDSTCHLVSRITRWLIQEGVEAQRITQDGAVLAHPWEADPGQGVGEPSWEDGAGDYDADCPYCADGTVHTHPYVPKGQDDPNAGNLPDGADYN